MEFCAIFSLPAGGVDAYLADTIWFEIKGLNCWAKRRSRNSFGSRINNLPGSARPRLVAVQEELMTSQQCALSERLFRTGVERYEEDGDPLGQGVVGVIEKSSIDISPKIGQGWDSQAGRWSDIKTAGSFGDVNVTDCRSQVPLESSIGSERPTIAFVAGSVTRSAGKPAETSFQVRIKNVRV